MLPMSQALGITKKPALVQLAKGRAFLGHWSSSGFSPLGLPPGVRRSHNVAASPQRFGRRPKRCAFGRRVSPLRPNAYVGRSRPVKGSSWPCRTRCSPPGPARSRPRLSRRSSPPISGRPSRRRWRRTGTRSRRSPAIRHRPPSRTRSPRSSARARRWIASPPSSSTSPAPTPTMRSPTRSSARWRRCCRAIPRRST